MAMLTYKSDEARAKLRDILDEVTAGQEVVIQRYDRPIGVLVPFEQWKALKVADGLAEAKRILAKIKNGDSAWVSSSEVMDAVLAKRQQRLATEQHVDVAD